MKNLINDNEAVFIASPSNLFYFTGMKNSDAYALFTNEEKFYFTDERYLEEAENNLKGFTIKNVKELHDFFKTSGIKTLGIEGSLTHDVFSVLTEDGVEKFYHVDQRISKIRAVKSPQEIELIKKAQEITDKTFNDILSVIKEGISEIELAGTLESLLYVNGADDLAFTSIVAFGANGSKPHAERSEKRLTQGTMITMDFGAKYRNYCSDMTRTVFFGTPDEEQKKIYNHVLTAQEMAIGIAHSGMTGRELDAMARNYFTENGLGDYFIHSLGHGVGLDVHESPRASRFSDDVMEDNMIVTVEPGLYFPEKFGVRIEDMIIFNKSGVINLTKSPKNMIMI